MSDDNVNVDNSIDDLDILRSDVDREHNPYRIVVSGEELVLQNPMRLEKTKQDVVLAAFDDLQKVEKSAEKLPSEVLGTQIAAMNLILKEVTAEDKGTALISALGGDVILTSRVIERWGKKVDVGKSSPSST